ncbi:RDD family protein [Streptomyces sp. NPDC056367]|uniref:RDD family protein n=1 Tax=Streptomyces sp. NPDC056367 TaxID=3345797 RepID=UPI0035E01BAE
MAREGYYPDPSIPGYVRYWNGLSWVPGTSRPAAAVPAARSEETGPVFLDQPAVWQADPVHQAGFGGPHDRRVSWGSPEPEPRPGISLARPQASPEPRRLPAYGTRSPEDAEAGSRRDRVDAGASPQGAAYDASGFEDAEAGRRRGRVDAGASPQGAEHDHALPSDPWKRSAPEETPRRPHGPGGTSPAPAAEVPPAPAAPAWSDTAWPEAAGASVSGLTSSWPEAEPAPAPPREAMPRPEAWPPRAAGARPALPRPAEDARPVPPRPAEDIQPATPREAAPREAAPREAAPREAAPRQATPREAEAWPPRAAGTRPVLPRPAQDTPPAALREPREDPARAVFERMAEHAVRPAGLGRRFAARVLDSLVYAAAAYAAARPLLPGATAHIESKVDAARASGRATTVWLLDATITGRLALVLGAVLLFGILYEVLPTARWGRTPGKGLLGVRVLAAATLRPPRFGAALRRWLVYAFLGLPGSLACLGDRPRRRAWHDRAAKTYVSR